MRIYAIPVIESRGVSQVRRAPDLQTDCRDFVKIFLDRKDFGHIMSTKVVGIVGIGVADPSRGAPLPDDLPISGTKENRQGAAG